MKEEKEENLSFGNKNSENEKVFSPGKIRITTLPNNNPNLMINKLLENDKEELEYLNDNEEEYDLNKLNQYKKNNNEEENIDNNNEQIEKEDIFYSDNESEEEENDDYNNEDNINENNNQSFNVDKNKKYVEEYIVEGDNNNNMDEDKGIKENNNGNENDKYNENNKNDNNDRQNIEEDGEDEYNSKYNLPLSICTERNYIKEVNDNDMNEIGNEMIDINNFKEVIDMEKYKNNNIEIKGKGIKNNDLNYTNKKMDNENGIKKDDILNKANNNENNKKEIKENQDEKNNEKNDKKEEDKVEKNNENVKDEENYEEYILNILAKLKKNNKLKINKENILFQNINRKFSSSIEIKRNITPEKKNNKLFSTFPNLNTFPIEKYNKEKEYNTLTVNKSIKFDTNSEEVDIPEEIKFGIDDTGNPLNISKFFEKDCDKKLIALIIQKNDKNNFKNNFPIDMKGNILQKSKDGNYLYNDGEKYIVINDFNVKYPELRVLTQKKYNFEKNKNEKENNEKKEGIRNINVIENGHIIKTYIGKKNNNGKNGMYNNKNETNKIWSDNLFNNSNDMKNGNNNIYYKEIEKMKLKKAHNFIIKNDNNENNKFKFSNSLSFINEKANFIDMMNIWRERYGKMNTKYNSYKNSFRNLKYNYSSISNDDRMVQRTNSILKIASEKYNRNNNNFNDNSNRSELSYTKRYSKIDIKKIYNKKLKIFIFNNNIKKKQCNSIDIIGRNTDNSKILKTKGTINYSNKNNNKISMITKNILNRRTNIIYGYNSYKTNINNSNRQIKDFPKNILDNNKQNLDKLEKNKILNKITNNIIHNYNKNNSKSYNIQTKNNSVINDYIYKNIKEINNKNKSKKIKYSILSNEANEIIKNYNQKQKKIDQKENINEKSFNNAFNSGNNKNTNFMHARNSFQL